MYLPLPFGPGIASGDRRVVMVLSMPSLTGVTVRLSQGPRLRRRQFQAVAEAVDGPCVVIGADNVVGPMMTPSWRDVGPLRRNP